MTHVPVVTSMWQCMFDLVEIEPITYWCKWSKQLDYYDPCFPKLRAGWRVYLVCLFIYMCVLWPTNPVRLLFSHIKQIMPLSKVLHTLGSDEDQNIKALMKIWYIACTHIESDQDHKINLLMLIHVHLPNPVLKASQPCQLHAFCP